MDDTTKLIRLVISTLNDVEVRGKDNLDKLLGSINALETVAQALEASTAHLAEPSKEEVNG